MAIKIDQEITPAKLRPKLERVFELSAGKLRSLEESWNPAVGTPVFTVNGRYTSRGWTEWTQGFQFGSALLQFDATAEEQFLELGRSRTLSQMAPHLTHVGVHDHGFSNVSTYGNLWRLMREQKIAHHASELQTYELALKVSGAVQASRWTSAENGCGFVYSFNGPHSLFIDTVRSLRSLAMAHQLGHVLMGERDRKISLLQRLVVHGLTSAAFSVYYGRGRDRYDVPGRVAHESVFNVNDGSYRCPSTQQGYSPFTTWTRGLAWAILGFAEQLEFLATLRESHFDGILIPAGVKQQLGLGEAGDSEAQPFLQVFKQAAAVTADFYIGSSCADGIPMWDTGAPGLLHLGDYDQQPANPFNPWEPVDSSAAAIAAQGLIRLGNYLNHSNNSTAGSKYRQAGLTVARTLMQEPYLSTSPAHQGLLLHSVYHRPNGWDHIAPGQKVPNNESSMWGDYHFRELALLLLREAAGEPAYRFFGANPETR